MLWLGNNKMVEILVLVGVRLEVFYIEKDNVFLYGFLVLESRLKC